MKALIDGDVIRYRAGFSVESKLGIEPIENCLHNVRMMIEDILSSTKADDVEVILSGRTNYRVDLYPEYKANRPDRKPVYYADIGSYLQRKWPTTTVEWIEADDWLGIQQTEDTIICTIDKDLDMIAGWHYNFVKGDMYCVDESTADRNFYKQLLTGDSVDNIPGLPGVGTKRADRILEGATCNTELYARCREAYGERGFDDEYMTLQANLLWIMREPFTLWVPPKAVQRGTSDVK